MGNVLIRTAIQWLFRGLAVAAALLATAQPVLGSFAFFRRSETVDYAAVHLAVGGIIYNLSILLAVLAFFTRFQRRWLLLAICLGLYGLTHLQLRLGLGTNTDASRLAYHIPVGVLIVVVSYVTAALSFGLNLDANQA